METEKSPHHHKETCGNRNDIDENTPVSDIKAPNVFERAKEEIEALVQTIHTKKDSHFNEKSPHHHKETHGNRNDIDENTPMSDIKAPNVFERAKEEMEALVQTIHTKKDSHSNEKSPRLHKESHGNRNDIDENTPVSDIKAPNVFERAKEEIEALVQTIHTKRDSRSNEKRDRAKEAELKPSDKNSPSENGGKSPNLYERAKEEIEEFIHSKSSPTNHRHRKETHGRSDDIDENTPVSDVKGPNVFQRAKEEIEALVEAIHSKKESNSNHPSKEH